ncbi:hypothetical protein BCR34DRAFT_557426 [Clohesyomyces aquaticus]|uniref:Uncharacterized protein n=1 Tax=Clohesyomyces aquaticus TaxID=1231657 RepID=A0A1Y2A1B8_9PLEO|nr:hypothetical protein BCR34DRAFT_557426 [Clohesyomyces aquaticus]
MVPAMRSPVSRRIPRLATSRQVAMVGRKRPYATKPDSAEPAPPLPHRPAEHQAQAQTHETSSLPMAEQRQPKTSVGSVSPPSAWMFSGIPRSEANALAIEGHILQILRLADIEVFLGSPIYISDHILVMDEAGELGGQAELGR